MQDQNRKSYIGIFFISLFKKRKLDFTVITPCRPEIEDNRFSVTVRKLYFVSIYIICYKIFCLYNILRIEKSFFCQRAIIFFYIHSDNRYGCIDIFVDGKYKKTIDGYNTTGWGNRESDFIFSSNKPGNHTFTLKMSQGDKNKIFDLDGFCYC